MAFFYRRIPLHLVMEKNLNGVEVPKIIPLFVPHERDKIVQAMREGMKFESDIEPVGLPVTDPVRGFFFGHVFQWVVDVYEKYTQEDVTCKPELFAKSFLGAIYKGECQKYSFGDITFNVEVKPISFSKSESMKRMNHAIDIWTKFFAELGETFPIPDKEWRTNGVKNKE